MWVFIEEGQTVSEKCAWKTGSKLKRVAKKAAAATGMA
jgi:hypothetical protein